MEESLRRTCIGHEGSAGVVTALRSPRVALYYETAVLFLVKKAGDEMVMRGDVTGGLEFSQLEVQRLKWRY
jgi:hypothetical protein